MSNTYIYSSLVKASSNWKQIANEEKNIVETTCGHYVVTNEKKKHEQDI